jgi:hypothetical protein
MARQFSQRSNVEPFYLQNQKLINGFMFYGVKDRELCQRKRMVISITGGLRKSLYTRLLFFLFNNLSNKILLLSLTGRKEVY